MKAKVGVWDFKNMPQRQVDRPIDDRQIDNR